MGATYIIPSFLPMILFLFVGQISVGEFIFSKKLLPNLLTGLAWCMTFILVYTWTYQKPWFMSLICYDFVIGTAIFLFLSSLEIFLAKIFSARLSAIFLSALNFFCLLIPFVQAVYYCMFWHCLSPASLMSLYLTNWKESLNFIQSNLGIFPTILIFSAIFFLLRLAYKSHKKFCDEVKSKKISSLQKISVIFILIGTFSAMNYFIPQSSIALLWKDVTDYVAETQKFSQNYAERFSDLKIDPSQTSAAKTPGTIIFVIGESASRSYMHAFDKNFPFENTPWLDSKLSDDEKISRGKNFDLLVKIHEDFKQNEKNSPKIYQTDGEFLIFQNAYASWSQTVPVLQRALTEQSQYNQKEFYNSISIIDAAKKSGYKTYWFSNQGRYGEYDSAITLVAKTADFSDWTDDAYDFSDKEDEILLKFFEKVNPAENNFIVFHLMGSHIYYNNRYPRSFKKWVTADGTGMMTSAAAYSNTILYTDFVLSKFFDYAKENLNLQAMIYFSDHGEDLQISHNPDVFSYEMVRIPFFIYLSPDYEKIFPEQTKILRSRKKEFFTNDMMYDTLCGIINAKSENYDSAQDFSSTNYRFNRENLTTMLGQRKISDDVEN
ncbi:MAG: sulfatase-like hydrolase/transferase [Selenomonadaceae bacterium]|nr:sulfatase-like hydrolase/transferase [Selenomonadaceae bacterium]